MLEIAGKYLNLVAPGADAKSRADIAEKILPTLMKLDQGRGLELDLPPSISETSNILENK